MKRQSGSHRLYLASSATEKTPVANSERLHSVLATLEDCRAVLLDSSDRETALLVSMAVLDLRMKLHRIADSELKALCDAMSGNEAPAERSHEPKSLQGRRRRPLLKLSNSDAGFIPFRIRRIRPHDLPRSAALGRQRSLTVAMPDC
jgi:hypothetical protein